MSDKIIFVLRHLISISKECGMPSVFNKKDYKFNESALVKGPWNAICTVVIDPAGKQSLFRERQD